MALAAAVDTIQRDPSARALYDKLEDRVLARDQVGASESYYDLVRSGRPLTEMLREAVRIHGPYTHVPYHERIDNGFVNFVNNDHCLLSARATLNLSKWLPAEVAGLPMAQTIWYIPTGLDIWNQKINKAPGHYARGMRGKGGIPPNPPKPIVHWPDQEPRASRRALARPPRPLADAGASRPRARGLSRVPGAHAEQAGAQGGAGRAGVRRPHRSAGPRLPQPLLHHRPQVLSGARHGRAGHGHRLGRCTCRALCGSAGHRRRPALVLDLRDGVQLRHPLPRAAEDLGHPLRAAPRPRSWRCCRTRSR